MRGEKLSITVAASGLTSAVCRFMSVVLCQPPTKCLKFYIYNKIKPTLMFIQLKHKSLDVYKLIRELVKEIYKTSLLLPADEKFNLIPQIRRAAVSVKLNLAEGSSRRSIAERNRYLEISRGSLVEIDAALETAVDLNYFEIEGIQHIGHLLNRCFAMLTGMIKKGVLLLQNHS